MALLKKSFLFEGPYSIIYLNLTEDEIDEEEKPEVLGYLLPKGMVGRRSS